MYNTTEAYREQVKKLPQNFRMFIKVILDASAEDITLETEAGESLKTESGASLLFSSAGEFEIPADDIFDSGFAECVFLSTFAIGTSIRPNWWVRIFNENGKYNNDTLATAEFYPFFTLYDDDGNVTDTIPIGVFHTDKITVQDNDLRIDCFDRMGYLEKLYVPKNTKFSLYQIAGFIAHGVHSQLLSTPLQYSLLSLAVDDSIFTGYSQKQVLELIATVLGCFVQFDNSGNLIFKWFTSTDVELSGDYANSALSLNGNTFSLDGNVVKVTGVRVVNEDTELAMQGTDDYLLTINENPIAALYPSKVAGFVLHQIQNTKYIPCEWKRIGGDPSLQLGDIITIIDNKETFNEENYEQYNKYPLYMTGRNWKYNVGGFSDVYTSAGNAEKDLNTDKGMTQSKKMAQLAKRITETKKDLTEEMDSRQEFLLLFNETIAASIGFYTTCVEDENGAVIQYMHDKPLLEDSGTIYTKGINGFAWTNDGWNDGNPVWQYGFDKNGNAILNQIYTYNLTADVIVSGLLQSKNGASWIDMDTGEFQFGTTANKPHLVLEDGKLRIYGELVLDDSIFSGITDSQGNPIIRCRLSNTTPILDIGSVTDIQQIYLKAENLIYFLADTVASTAQITVSDYNLKKDVSLLDERYFQFFNDLSPVTFKYIDGKSNRTHIGFIAQQVKEAAEKAGLTTQEIAMYVETQNVENEEGICALRYEEFVALNTAKIQQLEKKVVELEKGVLNIENGE